MFKWYPSIYSHIFFFFPPCSTYAQNYALGVLQDEYNIPEDETHGLNDCILQIQLNKITPMAVSLAELWCN